MNEFVFRPIADKKHFALLEACCDQPCATLMACDGLTFVALENETLSLRITGADGREWHMYGDARWMSPAVWVEFPLSFGGESGHCGVLVLNEKIPAKEKDPLAWCAQNNPLSHILPNERGSDVVRARLQKLRAQTVPFGKGSQLHESAPSSIQCYCIFVRAEGNDVRSVATYTDILTEDGIPIQHYRMASFQSYEVDLCRLALHSLFCLNEARRAGESFLSIEQIRVFSPLHLDPGRENPKWAKFHPSRVIRTRPQLRALPPPSLAMDGLVQFDDFERVTGVCRRAANYNLLAFERMARPHNSAIFHNDTAACLSAFIHRANGGAVYVLPAGLVEEFDNTDCGEVLVGDITLPFPNVFLKFTPPHPLFLAPDAPVDGCYVVKQDKEYLFVLTSFLKSVDYPCSLPITCIDPTFSLHLPADDSGMNINTAVERGIDQFMAENAPPEEDLSTTVQNPDGTSTTLIDGRAESRRRRIEMFRSQEPVFRTCLNIVVNAACFIAFCPDDISDAWEGEPSAELLDAAMCPGTTRSKRDKKRAALTALEVGDFTRIKICGRNLFADAASDGSSGGGKSPRTHWRRGHWRRQRHGVGLSLVILRWIRPTIVKKGKDPFVEARIYEV